MKHFFFSSRRRHTRLVSDWSSDVCSSDLAHGDLGEVVEGEVVEWTFLDQTDRAEDRVTPEPDRKSVV